MGLLTSWLGTIYHSVQARNMGFSGTGSEFANYRLTHDLDGFVPDLVFLEFTVNDAGSGRAHIFAQVDALIYRLRQINPRTKFIYISTTASSEEPQRRAGSHAAFVQDSIDVAAFEGIPFIDATSGMWAKVLAGTASTTDFLTDTVHPNDAGHEIYFESIRDGLAPMLPLPVQPSVTGSKLIAQSKLQNARFEPGTAAVGCKPATLTMGYMNEAKTCDLGDTFTYAFNGTTVGVLRAMTRNGGRMECLVDGANPMRVDFYDAIANTWERPFPYMIYRGLADAQHTLSCRITADLITLPEGTSTGHLATIGYFLVSSEQPVTLP